MNINLNYNKMKTLKNYFLFFLIVGLASCSEPLYENSMPIKGQIIQNFPIDLIGTYVNDSNSELDTIMIDKQSLTINNDDVFYLKHDSLHKNHAVLKSFKQYFVLNIKADDNWIVIPFKFQNNSIDVFTISSFISEDISSEEELSEEKLDEINQITDITINTKFGTVDKYTINPTDKEFYKLLKKGVYSSEYNYTKIE